MSERSLARLNRAERKAIASRARLVETLDQIQVRLSPANILSETSRNLREKGLEMTDNLVGSLRSRPVMMTILASALGWILSRRPALALLLKLFLRGSSATSDVSKHSTNSKPQRPKRPRNASRPTGAIEEMG